MYATIGEPQRIIQSSKIGTLWEQGNSQMWIMYCYNEQFMRSVPTLGLFFIQYNVGNL